MVLCHVFYSYTTNNAARVPTSVQFQLISGKGKHTHPAVRVSQAQNSDHLAAASSTQGAEESS